MGIGASRFKRARARLISVSDVYRRARSFCINFETFLSLVSSVAPFGQWHGMRVLDRTVHPGALRLTARYFAESGSNCLPLYVPGNRRFGPNSPEPRLATIPSLKRR